MSLPKEAWELIIPLLPIYLIPTKKGRPRLDKQKILEGILYVNRNGIAWNSVPKEFGSGTSLNDYFREWARKGVFHELNSKYPNLFFGLNWDRINSLYQYEQLKEKK